MSIFFLILSTIVIPSEYKPLDKLIIKTSFLKLCLILKSVSIIFDEGNAINIMSIYLISLISDVAVSSL